MLVLGLRGETLNTMLIAGLGVAMAILVADVVTDVVNVRRYLHGAHGRPVRTRHARRPTRSPRPAGRWPMRP